MVIEARPDVMVNYYRAGGVGDVVRQTSSLSIKLLREAFCDVRIELDWGGPIYDIVSWTRKEEKELELR